jgi:sugar-specific transcriptional regulator TrmB
MKPKKSSHKNVTESDILSRLGLTPHESAAYLALLDGGPASLSELAARTGLHRALLYRAIPSLEEAGLVSVAPHGRRRRFAAESPERLRASFDELSAGLETLLPELERRRVAKSPRPEVRFTTGPHAIADVMEDMVRSLKNGDVYMRYSSRRESTDVERYLPASYRRLRDAKQLQRFVITTASRAAKMSSLNRAIKVVPGAPGSFDFDVNVVIYGDKVVYLDYNSETALVISNPMIAAFHRQAFRLLYDRL